jgi:beta-lactamase regulating signal transducer with metallopeptidase domain
MHEHIARVLYYFDVHLLYSSIVWLAAWVVTSIPRGSATTKYWIWVATSLNFIFPLGAALDKVGAAHLSWASPLGVIGDVANSVSRSPATPALGTLWLLGAALMLTRLCLRIRRERREAPVGKSALDPRRSFFAHGVPVRFAGSRQGPAVDGILHPHISLPDGLDRLLTKPELDAVLTHEVTHARRRDNLIRLIHEVGLCGLWFHPLVWITGFRISLYRELSCDESVIQRAHGDDLVSALAKLANPEEAFLLQSTASSHIGRRLARLAQPQVKCSIASALLGVMFSTVLLGGVFGTVAHTACCFVVKK